MNKHISEKKLEQTLMKCNILTDYDFLGLISTIFDVRYRFFSL